MKHHHLKFDKDGYQLEMQDFNGEALPSKDARRLDKRAQAALGIPSPEAVLSALRSKPKRGKAVRLDAGHAIPARKKLKMSQKDFASLVGVTPSAVRNWEQARVEIPTMAEKLFYVIEHRPDVLRYLVSEKATSRKYS